MKSLAHDLMKPHLVQRAGVLSLPRLTRERIMQICNINQHDQPVREGTIGRCSVATKRTGKLSILARNAVLICASNIQVLYAKTVWFKKVIHSNFYYRLTELDGTIWFICHNYKLVSFDKFYVFSKMIVRRFSENYWHFYLVFVMNFNE